MSKIFRFEAEGDAVYVQAGDIEAARQTFKDSIFGDVPDELLTVTEVTELPEGEELLNPEFGDQNTQAESGTDQAADPS